MKFYSLDFQIDGLSLELNRKCGIFVTINSDSAVGYPPVLESFNMLFRPICCPEPDEEHIALVSLIATGFVSARPLARKVSILYQLAKEQLSGQSHYHFGLGSMMKVLATAGQMRLDSACKALTEYSIVVRVLSMVNLPVLHPADSQLFKSLIKDVFPGVDCPTPAHEQMRRAVAQLNDESSLEFVSVGGQEQKIIELHEVMSVSRATIVLGATGSGKSAIVDQMIRARNVITAEGGKFTRCVTLNPKECDLSQLFGYYEQDTKLWHDGLFSSIFRDVNQVKAGDAAKGNRNGVRERAEHTEEVIIRCDGDMDESWVETLNTVLDNNRMLILGNGERLYLNSNCSLLFEATHLRNVTPATVARCGLVFCDTSALGYTPYWTRWLRQICRAEGGRGRRLRKKLQKLFRTLFVPCLEFVMEGGGNLNFQRIQIKSVISQNELGYVRQFCEIFALLLDIQTRPPSSSAATSGRTMPQQHSMFGAEGKVDEVEESGREQQPRLNGSNSNPTTIPITQRNNNGRGGGEIEPGDEENVEKVEKNLNNVSVGPVITTTRTAVEVKDATGGACKRDGESNKEKEGEQPMAEETEEDGGVVSNAVGKVCVDESVAECLFIQALYASCGALIGSPADRGYFDEFIKGRLEDRPVVQDNEESPAGPTEIPSAYPTLYDYCFDKRSKKWMAWQWLVPRCVEEQQQRRGKHNGGDKLAVYDVHVPTRDTISMNFYLSLCSEMWPVLLLGSSAVGKTSLVNHFLRGCDSKKNVSSGEF